MSRLDTDQAGIAHIHLCPVKALERVTNAKVDGQSEGLHGLRDVPHEIHQKLHDLMGIGVDRREALVCSENSDAMYWEDRCCDSRGSFDEARWRARLCQPSCLCENRLHRPILLCVFHVVR
ncbi:MAG: hypothetical protein D6690_17335 [Nitrospirae bacterium]|nr:MAG: hypothetical protein D6690_17335 [Nitrospirota bacterium]